MRWNSHFVVERVAMAACLAATAATLASACGSTTESITAPSTSRCGIQADVPASAFPSPGGTGTLRVTTSRECTWTARSDAAWLTFTAAANGQGDGSVPFAVAENAEPSTRRAGITINDVRVEVAQSGRPCEFTLGSDRESVGASGGERAVRVNTSGTQCTWSAASNVSWVTMLTPAGTGPGDARFLVAATSGSARTATLTIAGRTVMVTQTPGCTVSVSPSTYDAPAAGGTGFVTVTAAAGCAWSAATSAAWISITSGANGSGPGEVRFTTAPAAGPARSGTIVIGDQTVTVNQGYGCTFTINPGSLTVPAAGGTSSLQMETQAGCDWTSASNAPWIVVSGGARGTGSGRIDLSVASNNGPSRAGTVTIAARAITIVQQDGCTFTLDRDRQAFPATGGTGSVSVGGLPACGWTAATTTAWISIDSGGSGTGNGQVQFSVAANTGPARTGTIAVGGRAFVVEQASGCSYRLSSLDLAVPGSGGSGSVALLTSAGCPWSTAPAAEWLSVMPASGTGPAQLQVSASPNLSPARAGTIVIAGQTVTVTQPSQCTYAFSPPSHVFGPDGGAGNILIIVSGPCSWTAVSTADWITMTAGTAGVGGGLIQFLAAPTPGPPRTGIIRIAGQDYLVSESGR